MPRPSSPLLSTALITDAALALVDKHGDFTMPGLAERLKVRPSSLYNHVAGRAEIIESMRTSMMVGIDIPADARSWSEAVSRIAQEYRRHYARHPRAIPLFTAHTVRAAAAFDMYNALATALSEGGFGPAAVLHAITTVDSFVLGSALDLAAPEEVWASTAEANDAMRAAVETSGAGRADAAFEFGLAVLIAGLQAQSPLT
ncbi:MAG: TetR/AcrR family transcriptional regulator C-terminal domain-containing protein [Rhodococcus sp. (in: high G+C Gram-positive bacteria)]